jgi:hypothetical protein
VLFPELNPDDEHLGLHCPWSQTQAESVPHVVEVLAEHGPISERVQIALHCPLIDAHVVSSPAFQVFHPFTTGEPVQVM